MQLFSQRKGLRPVKQVIQSDSMDDNLRNALWNQLDEPYWSRITLKLAIWEHKGIAILCRRLWDEYFHQPLDRLGDHWPEIYGKIRDYFFSSAWYDVYDFIELVAIYYPDESVNEKFRAACNSVLEREASGYRFVGERITEITSQEEMAEVEEGLHTPSEPAREHLKRSLELLSDRKNPDFRNAIKEAISAVESVCRAIAKDDNATLDRALSQVEKPVGLHPALKSAFSKLYGWTSDADGIRHALMDEPNLDFEEAKFMLVTCSAFVNYLIGKAAKMGMKL